MTIPFRWHGKPYTLRRPHERPAERSIPVPMPAALSTVVGALRESHLLRGQVAEALLLHGSEPADARVLERALRQALQDRRWLLEELPEPRWAYAVPERDEEEEPESAEASERDWIEVQLQDRRGTVIAGALVDIELPGGAKRRTRTDERGRVSFHGIMPGNCKVTFVGLHPVDRAPEFAAAASEAEASS